MSDRPSIEKDISDYKRAIGQLDYDARQLRDWIGSNERALSGMQETLRRITEEGISKARADLSQRESELQRLRGLLAASERVLAVIGDIERKQRDIATLEREQEQIIALLERHRTELRQLQLAYDELTRPQVLPSCELVLPNNQRVPLDAAKGEYVLGWRDAEGGGPDIDLHPAGGSAMGVSRKHALLRFSGGRWEVIDLSSTNGTYVNETAIAPNRPVALADRTKLRLGSLMLFFRYITQTTRL